MNRREFLIHTGAGAAGCLAGGLLAGCLHGRARHARHAKRALAIVSDPRDPVASAPPARWAVGRLQEALAGRGFSVRLCFGLQDAAPDEFCILAAGGGSAWLRDAGLVPPAGSEALLITPASIGRRQALVASGADPRGLAYALTEVADAVALLDEPWEALRPAHAIAERPANRVRSVIRLFVSDVEDKGWFNDREFWRDYLSLLATERFNRINLSFGLGYDGPEHLRDAYFYFTYPFLLAVPGYDVRATNLPDAERDRNLEMLRFISDEAAGRGLEFQLGLWTHAYRWIDSPNVNHVIEGLTPQTQAPYSRDALALVLKECPNITGVTFRIHGESGVAEGSYDLWRTIFDGCVRSGRRVGIDLHAKGIDQPTIDAALATGLPLTISPKFWAEHLGLPYHQAAIRPTELPKQEKGRGLFAQSEGARSFLRYGYGDLLKRDRPYAIVHRIWPGTQRVLLWGDPVFAAAYGRAMSFCGSQGAEVFDPLSFKGRKGSGLPGGRDGYADLSLRAGRGDYEKYRYTYRLWGRLLFNPEADPQSWRRLLRRDHGAAAPAVESALAPAGRLLPLVTTAHLPSAANNNYWPEMYVNMAIADDATHQPYTDTPEPKNFGGVSPLDPQLFARIDDFADDLLSGEFTAQYSPVEVAQWLEDLAQTAADGLTRAEALSADRQAPVFRRCAIDVRVQIGLGRFFAQKLRAGVLFALFQRTGDRTAAAAAVKAYRSARALWAQVAAATADVYVPDVTYGEGWFQRGHWSDRLVAIDKDIELMAQRADATPGPSAKPPVATVPAQVAELVREVLGRPRRASGGVVHVAPATFRRGESVPLVLNLLNGLPPVREVRLWYRHTQQAEPWLALPTQREGGACRVSIPGDYSDSPYPLEYYFEIRPESGRPWPYPGLNATLSNQPYFVVA